jgi:hypothetical protein
LVERIALDDGYYSEYFGPLSSLGDWIFSDPEVDGVLQLLVALVLNHVSTAPIPPSAQKPLPYYPTQIGAKSVYICAQDEITVVISAVENGDSESTVMADTLWGKEKAWSETISVSNDSLTRLEFDGQELNAPHCFLKSRVRPGEKWTVNDRYFGSKTTYTAIEPQEIKVPAGRFSCIGFEVNYKGKPENRATRQWYAPGIGLVKEAVKTPDGWVDSRVLKSFTHP